jgi:hypothetical protein
MAGFSSAPAHRRPYLGRWAWFAVWSVVGACVVMCYLLLPLALLFFSVAAVGVYAALRWGSANRRSVFGLITGAGLPLLLVAYIQRQGPGTVCRQSATGAVCDYYLDPRPWLAIGLVLVACGIAAFVRLRGRVSE